MSLSVPRSALLPPLLLLGLALFARGYFLSRSELRDVSTCDVVPGSAPPRPARSAGGSPDCWLPSSPDASDDASRGVFSRLVLIIVDGWRHDFAAPAGTPGPATMSGTRAEGSRHEFLYTWRMSKAISPWSLEKSTGQGRRGRRAAGMGGGARAQGKEWWR